MVGTMEHSLDKIIEQIKQFCKCYGVNLEIETWHFTLGDEYKVDAKVIKKG